jgi:SAM-dependent methyltransferase
VNERLQAETEKLVQSWARHEPGMLRDYLVSGVEDPRLNLQSILTRHFLVRGLTAEPPSQLMEQEVRFSAAMNLLLQMRPSLRVEEDAALLLHALRSGADNFEGTPIPGFLMSVFRELPRGIPQGTVPNYIADFLAGFDSNRSWDFSGQGSALETFAPLWLTSLQGFRDVATRKQVLEAACGSANDYRWLDAYGFAQHIEYSGFDLCAANIENARQLFPGVSFSVGNVFQIPANDRAYGLSFTHDLFEHLSPEGIEVAAAELCRVTQWGLSVGFFNMDDRESHQIEPYEDYHWNKLSAGQMKGCFERHGFLVRMIHIGTFFREQTGCDAAHNPNAWTFWLERKG